MEHDAPSPPSLPYGAVRKPPGVLLYGLIGAVVLGGIGFVGGFIGPIVFAPDANQGPLLGIFITGPGGAVVGFVAGLLFGAWKNRRRP